MFIKPFINKIYYNLLMPNVEVMSILSTINLIKKRHLNVIRFGDGEFEIISGGHISYQENNVDLAKELESILLMPDDKKALICVPGVFNGMVDYTDKSKKYWLDCLRLRRKLIKKIHKTNYVYGNSMISRPYMDFNDKENVGEIFRNLKSIWSNKNILIVEGENTRSGVGNDLFGSAKKISRIICPSHDAFLKKQEIEEKILLHKNNCLILLMLGPTAKIITKELGYIDNQIIDIGHIDSEYEWYRHGFTEKRQLTNKETAEVESTELQPVSDPQYYKQIVDVVR